MANFADVIFKSEVILSKILVERNGRDFVLICSGESHLYIYNFHGSMNLKDSWLRSELIFSVKLDSEVVDLIIFEKKVYAILKIGQILKVEPTGGNQDDEDMFIEESPEVEPVLSWQVEELCSLPTSYTVLSAACCKLGILLLARLQNDLDLFLLKDKILARYTLVTDNAIISASICILNISNLGFDFMRVWLSHVERSSEFLIVGLSNGSVLCLPLTLPFKHYCVYTSIHSIIAVSWFQERNCQRFDALVFVLDSGAVVRLTPVGEEVTFPFLPYLEKVITLKNCILTLNELNSRFLSLSNESNQCKLLPVSQITSACFISQDSKCILISDQDCNLCFADLITLDSLNDSIDIRKTICEPLPKSSDLNKLIASSEQLEQINKTFKNLDEFLRAKSLIARSNILNKHFKVTIKVIQVLDDNHTIRIKIIFNIGGIIFSKEFWKLNITIYNTSSNLSYQKDLISNISNDKHLVQLITLPIKFDLLYDFECKLVYIESKNIELNLSLGKVEMNAGHFLFPISLKELCLASDDNLWTDHKNKYFVNLNIPEDEDISAYFLNLLKDSKALWRQNEWKNMLKSQEASCVLFGHEIVIKILNNALNIESNNLKACQAVKFAALVRMKDKKENLAHYLLGWNQAENIIKLSGEPESHMSDLYNIVKTS